MFLLVRYRLKCCNLKLRNLVASIRKNFGVSSCNSLEISGPGLLKPLPHKVLQKCRCFSNYRFAILQKVSSLQVKVTIRLMKHQKQAISFQRGDAYDAHFPAPIRGKGASLVVGHVTLEHHNSLFKCKGERVNTGPIFIFSIQTTRKRHQKKPQKTQYLAWSLWKVTWSLASSFVNEGLNKIFLRFFSTSVLFESLFLPTDLYL